MTVKTHTQKLFLMLCKQNMRVNVCESRVLTLNVCGYLYVFSIETHTAKHTHTK